MAKLTVGGTVVEGVTKALVRVAHNNPKAPDPVPNMEWDLIIRLQYDDTLPKWAMAKQGPDRFKKCELVVHNSNQQPAHTWTLLSAYTHKYEEVEFPATGGEAAGEGGYYVNVVLRGHMQEAKDYTGENVMTVAKGEERALPG
jgi:hypothetical protein